MSATIGCFLLLSLSAVLAWKYIERVHHLSLVPAEFHVRRILYVETEAWGFGPGGNETGVLMYELQERIVKQIERDGLAFLNTRTGTEDWNATPLAGHLEWFEGEGALPQAGPVKMPHLANYLNQYGFGIPIDATIISQIDQALIQPGNYYAYTGTGVLVLIPAARRLAFVYAG